MQRVILCLMAIGFLSACGPNGGFAAQTKGSFGSNAPSEVAPGEPLPPGETGELGICSELALMGVTWPSTLSLDQKRSMALALNISGSFEGPDGWSNLTNNFDGMGVSFGLLNQNLGSGSLQPLWIKMRDRYGANFKSLFGSSRYASLLAMLKTWEASNKTNLMAYSEYLIDGRLSALDEEVSDFVEPLANENKSVDWAVANLYSDSAAKTFHSSWKAELLKLGSHPDYVSIQIEAALRLHTKTLSYMTTLKMKERRSYLLLFDIVVQNGGLYAADIEDYQTFFGTSSPSETSRLNKILELRLRHVKSQYRSDVQARKSAIINGSGRVHGSNRNFEKEYCFDGSVPVAK